MSIVTQDETINKKVEECHNPFIVYFGINEPSFGTPWNRGMALYNTLSSMNYDNNHSIYASEGFNNHCYAAQVVRTKPYMSNVSKREFLDTYLEQDSKRIISECDMLQLYSLLYGIKTTENLSSLRIVSKYLDKMLNINISELLQKLDFTYISLDISHENKKIYMARGLREGTCSPLWFGQDLNRNFFFSNVPDIIKQYCRKIYEFPKGCYATIDATGKMQFYDGISGMKIELGDECLASRKDICRGMMLPIIDEG